MLNKIKQLVNGTPEAPAPEPSLAPVSRPDPYMLGLQDAVHSGWYNQETNELFKGFPISASDTVLDVGCGDGGNVHFCAMRGAKVIIADIDAAKIEATRQRLAETPARELECLVTNSNPLPLATGTATRVVCTEVIEHVDDPRAFLAELVRVGQHGGLYLLSVPHPSSEDIQKDFAAPDYFQKPHHIRVISEDEFKSMVTDAGLEILNHSQHGFYWSLWMLFFWEAKVGFDNPDHPLLQSWTQTWQALLSSPRGPAIKQALDSVIAKSQVIIARKP